ncbi:MAG: hypothetical protein Q8755_03020 [Candidatus Phytoplasma australasiaticum]|nr:hypothetical protein [Candidatus Phytoplasma australasiaticum]
MAELKKEREAERLERCREDELRRIRREGPDGDDQGNVGGQGSGGAGTSGTSHANPEATEATQEEPPQVTGGNRDEYDVDPIGKGVPMGVIYFSDLDGVIQGVLRPGDELEEGEIPQKFNAEDMARIF